MYVLVYSHMGVTILIYAVGVIPKHMLPRGKSLLTSYSRMGVTVIDNYSLL